MTQKYHQQFVLLQESIAMLNSNTPSLSQAVQEYAKGIERKNNCVKMLQKLEEKFQIKKEPIELTEHISLEDVFEQLDGIEQHVGRLPDSHLEELLSLVESAEQLIGVGENHILQMTSSLNEREPHV